MVDFKFFKLSELADVIVSGVDKKSKPGQKEVKLCNFTDVYYNWAITSSLLESFMVATAKDNEIKTLSIKKGYVALTKDSETRYDIGISTYIADNLDGVVLGYHCALIKPNEKMLCGKYLNCLLQTQYARTYFANNAKGSGQRYSLTQDCLNDMKVPLPMKNGRVDMDYQKKIGNLFSSIDRKIEINQQINRNLEELARLIYDYWFVQFDFPDKNGKPYKSSCGKMVWNGTLKREIPEGWQLKRIEDVCERIQSGGTPATSRKDLYDGSLNWFSTQELQDNFLFDSIKHISPNALKESSAKLFPKDTILIAIYAAPTVGRLGILTEDSAFNQACCGFVVNKETVSKEYLFLHLKQSRDKLNTLSGGTAQKNLNVGKMQNFEILVPPYEIMNLFTHQVGKMFDKIKQTSEESKNLTNLRDFLLPLLMNGQVSLRG